MWSGEQPAFAGFASSRVFRGEITFSEGVVTRITLSTPMRWGNIFSVFGKPDEQTYIKSRLPAAQQIFTLPATVCTASRCKRARPAPQNTCGHVVQYGQRNFSPSMPLPTKSFRELLNLYAASAVFTI